MSKCDCGLLGPISTDSGKKPLEFTEPTITDEKQLMILKKNELVAQNFFDTGFVNEQKGDYECSILNYQACLKYNPHHVEAQNKMNRLIKNKLFSMVNVDLGKIKLAKCETKAAVDLFKTALRAYPSNISALVNLALIYYENGDLESCIQCNKRAISFGADDPTVYFNLACALHDMHCLDEAIEMYRSAILIDPLHKDAYFNIGVAFQETDKLAEASLYFKQACSVDPTFSEAIAAFESLRNFPKTKQNIRTLPQRKSAKSKYSQEVSSNLENQMHTGFPP